MLFFYEFSSQTNFVHVQRTQVASCSLQICACKSGHILKARSVFTRRVISFDVNEWISN